MKKFLLWQFMINKRLLHKKIFVLLLCLVPLLVWGMGRISQEDSGILTILLSVEDPQDEMALRIVEEVLAQDSILYYEQVAPELAYEQVAAGKADCAWIFRENFEEKLFSTFAGDEVEPPVYVVAQEDTVALKLARTKLYAFVYAHQAKLLGEYYMETQIPGMENFSVEDFQVYCENCAVEDSLFRMVYEKPLDAATAKQSYLMLPIRGILMILLLVCGLVVTMYYLQDEVKGTFTWVPVNRRRGLLYCYLLAACLDMGVVVWLALCICQKSLISLRELGILVLYVCMVAVFCELMKLLCRKGETLAKWIPLISLAMLGLCPVFLDLGSRFALQYLFPPTYYLRAVQSDGMVLWMAGYTVVLFVGETVWWRLAQNAME